MKTFIPIFKSRYEEISGLEEFVDLSYESQLHQESHQDLLKKHSIKTAKSNLLLRVFIKTTSYFSKKSNLLKNLVAKVNKRLFSLHLNWLNLIS